MNDPKIRSEFKRQYLQHVKPPCFIADEVGLMGATSIADLVVITPTALEGFEIKSGSDTLVRLPNQINIYSQIFDFVSIVTEPKYLAQIETMVPSFWGIIVVEEHTDSVGFHSHRNPTLNDCIKPRKIAELLWKDEVRSILEKRNIRGISRLNRAKLWDILSVSITRAELKEEVYKTLSSRTLWKKGLVLLAKE